MLTEIAKAQLTTENFAAALDTAQQIDNSEYRALVLTEIAKAQPQAENFSAVHQEPHSRLTIQTNGQRVLIDIAKAQAQTPGNFTAVN